jgi:hypothetical protein
MDLQRNGRTALITGRLFARAGPLGKFSGAGRELGLSRPLVDYAGIAPAFVASAAVVFLVATTTLASRPSTNPRSD